MARDEVLAWIKVPKTMHPHPSPLPVGERAGRKKSELTPSPLWGEGRGEGLPELLKVYKISKRYDDDISAVCLAINLHIEDGMVQGASIGAGGVALHPVLTVHDALIAKSYVLPPVYLKRGDASAALHDAVHTLRGEMEVGGQEHFY